MLSAVPYQWLTLDIETVAGSPEDAERYIINCYRPEAFGTWNEITIGRRIKEAYAAKAAKLSLLTAAPIICISMRSDQDLLCFHCLPGCTFVEDNGARVFPYPDLPTMLVAMRDWLDFHVSPDTLIVGHNITAFDLPKLRWAYTHHQVRMPRILMAARPDVFDIMKVYTKEFAVGQGIMVGLKPLLEEFGVDNHKGLVDGGAVQELYDAGEHDTIIRYALLDVIAEAELYLRMTGQSEALQ